MSEDTNKNHGEMTTLEELIQSNDNQQLTAFLENLLPVDFARAFFRLSKENRIRLLGLLGPEKSAAFISKISDFGSSAIVDQLPATQSIPIVMAPKHRPITGVMLKDPLSVPVSASLRELKDFFGQHNFLGVPVVDDAGILVGVVRNAMVREAVNQMTNQLFLKFAGIVGGEEFRSKPLLKRSSRRLYWLSINIVLNIVAASVIALYQDTLEKAIVLAVFLPIISDMSGCSGNQAVAVSIRELTLGLVRPRELFRVLSKESAIGIVNGIALGGLLSVAALLWKGNPYLGLVVGVALAANTFVAVSFGGLVPLVLRGLRTDPALASGPLLTTITDMCGFFFVLSFASVILPKLGGG